MTLGRAGGGPLVIGTGGRAIGNPGGGCEKSAAPGGIMVAKWWGSGGGGRWNRPGTTDVEVCNREKGGSGGWWGFGGKMVRLLRRCA